MTIEKRASTLGTIATELQGAYPRARLLIVDDEAINLQILADIFKQTHDLFIARNGKQAIELCKLHQPDLVLLDVSMPEMDGYEACKKLKESPETHDIPIIFITAHKQPDEEAAGLELGAVDYITKPINAKVVRARVHTHLALRHAIKQLADNERLMEQRIEARTQELAITSEHLRHSQEELIHSEAKAALSTLIASVSHELGTPLGNSALMANTLSEQTRTLSKQIQEGQLKRSELMVFLETLNQSAEIIQRNIDRAAELLKNFKQVAADQASEQRRTFDLSEAVHDVIGTLSPSLKRYPHHIDIHIPQGIELDSYPGALGQVLINLINNAYLHAFNDHKVGLLTITANIEADNIKLSICDDGVGMTPSDMEKMFQPFFSTKIGKGGTGLGMTIVKNMVCKMLGGEISVRSTLNEGSCFDISLPSVAPQQKNA